MTVDYDGCAYIRSLLCRAARLSGEGRAKYVALADAMLLAYWYAYRRPEIQWYRNAVWNYFTEN